ncbi:MAG: amidohydrolase [Pseudomonadota bacterium]
MARQRTLLLPGLSAIALLASGCDSTAPERQRIDLLVTEANGYNVLADATIVPFEVMAVDSGKVIALGDAALAQQFSATKTLAVSGATVLPGLIDAHGHVSSLGKLRQSLDVAGIASLDQTLSAVADYAQGLTAGEWVTGRGWNQVIWRDQQFPTAEDLDSVVAERPVFLNRIDGHAAWANTEALRLAGINADTVDPDGGKILRDAQGEATGVLIDSAMGLVERVIPIDTRERRTAHIKTALAELASLGITSVHDAGSLLVEISIYQALAKNNELPIRVSAMLGGEATLDAFNAPIRGYAEDRFETTSVKLYADGALGSRGAALLSDYSDNLGNTGLLFADAATMAKVIGKAHAKGFAAHIHAIGDAANRAVLDAFEELNDGKPSGLHDRIEHAQVLALDDIPRLKTLGITASVQPTHATSDKNMAEDRLGSERIKGAYAWRKFLDAGVAIAAGSDFPVEKPEMFDGLYAAISRQDKQGEPLGGWYPGEALTREETLAAFSIWAAASVDQDDRLGNLSPGQWADFIVIDRDYFDVPVAQIWQIDVLQTWVAGELVYRRD